MWISSGRQSQPSFVAPEEPFSQVQHIHWPEARGPRLMDAGTSCLGTAIQHAVDPLAGYGLHSVHGAQERPADGGVGTSISQLSHPCR